jgi:hypothetical protein
LKNQTKWPTNPADGLVHIPVCYKAETDYDIGPDGGAELVNDAGVRLPLGKIAPAYKQDWVTSAIRNSWNVVSNVRFEEFIQCPNDCTKRYVVVNIVDLNGGANADQGYPLGSRCPTATTRNTVSVNIATGGISRKNLELYAVHEFGHILGFNHEMDRADHDQVAIDAGYFSDADIDLTVTPYDPDSVMNYVQYNYNKFLETARSGALTALDIQGVQKFYAANPSLDDDRDSVPDRSDNCQYAANHGQTNSNFEAELLVARRSGFPGDDGHPPTASDPQSYVDRWQKTYRGDACDPVAVVVPNIADTLVGSNSDTCNPVDPAAPLRGTQGSFTFEGFRGDPLGTREPAVQAYARNAVCRCALAGQSIDDVIRCNDDPAYNCLGARDTAFPGTGALPSGFRRMTQCNTFPSAFDSPAILLKAPAPNWGYVPTPTTKQIWNSKADAVTVGAPVNALNGIVWSNAVRTVTPASAAPNTFTADLRNAYQSVNTTSHVSVLVPEIYSVLNCVPEQCPLCGNIWDFLSWRDLVSPPDLLVFGNDITETRIPVSQTKNGIASAQQRFTPAALAAFKLANTEVIGSRENVTGAIRNRVKATGALVAKGSAALKGFFSVLPNKLVDYTAVTGFPDEFGAAPVRLFVAGEGLRGSIVSLRAGNLLYQDVDNARKGVPTRQSFPFKGTIPVSPQSAAWNIGERVLYVLDVTSPTSTTRVLRLLRMDEYGDSKLVWADKVRDLASFPTAFYVQTAAADEVFVSVSFATRSEWVLLDTTGMALRSGQFTAPLAGSPILNDAMLVVPFSNGVGGPPEKGPIKLTTLNRARMTPGACNAPFLSATLNSVPCGPAWDGITPAALGAQCTSPSKKL